MTPGTCEAREQANGTRVRSRAEPACGSCADIAKITGAPRSAANTRPEKPLMAGLNRQYSDQPCWGQLNV